MLIAVFGVVIWLLIVFQTLVGMRVFKLGRRQRPVHKWIGFAIVALALVHGLAASSLFLGFPFKLG
jgi:hypothetical protein